MGAFSLAAVLFVVALGVLYQTAVAPLLRVGGVFRNVEPLNNQHCKVVPALEGCEKAILPDDSSSIYVACSRIAGRPYWLPSVSHLNASGKPTDDYVAAYSLDTGEITRLTLSGFDSPRGLSVHGMDVVPSALDPTKLFVYLVNHRAPLTGNAEDVGADSAIEIFETRIGSDVLKYVKTVEDPNVIQTPNDVVGTTDGKGFWFTNDHGVKIGYERLIEGYLRLSRTSVGYCHVVDGCKIAANKLHTSNGITKSPTNDTFYVASSRGGGIQVLEKQTDNTLVLTEVIPTVDMSFDNLSVDKNGAVWAASFPKGLNLLRRFKDLTIDVPSGAVRVTLNTGQSAFYGEKYKVEKVFEDDGHVVQGATTAVYSPDRKLLILTGISSPQLALCSL